MGNFIDFIHQHFLHAAPIVGCGAFALVIILERMHALLVDYSFPYAEAFFEKIRYMVMADRVKEALALCEQLTSKPFVRVIREGLIRAHHPENIIEHGLEIVVGEMNEKIQARIQYLAMLANVATLFGLLGTIVGLIQSFDAIGSANAQERAALLAAGISTAMNATMLGLAVAIPCLIFHTFLSSRANALTSEMDRAAVRILDLLQQRYYAVDPRQDQDDEPELRPIWPGKRG